MREEQQVGALAGLVHRLGIGEHPAGRQPCAAGCGDPGGQVTRWSARSAQTTRPARGGMAARKGKWCRCHAGMPALPSMTKAPSAASAAATLAPRSIVASTAMRGRPPVRHCRSMPTSLIAAARSASEANRPTASVATGAVGKPAVPPAVARSRAIGCRPWNQPDRDSRTSQAAPCCPMPNARQARPWTGSAPGTARSGRSASQAMPVRSARARVVADIDRLRRDVQGQQVPDVVACPDQLSGPLEPAVLHQMRRGPAVLRAEQCKVRGGR